MHWNLSVPQMIIIFSFMFVLMSYMIHSKAVVAEFEDGDWYFDANEARTVIHDFGKECERKHTSWLKKHKKEKKEQSKASWFGLTQAHYNKIFKTANLGAQTQFKQNDIAQPIPCYTNRSQWTKVTSDELALFGTTAPINTLYCIVNSQKNVKFNNPYILTARAEQNENKNNNDDIGHVNYTSIGGVDNIEDCVCVLNYFYRSARMDINRRPYVPDLTMKLTDIRGSGLKLEYRVLVYAFGCYVKVDFECNPSEIDTRSELMKNDLSMWSSHKNLSIQTLNNLFYHGASGSSRKYMHMANGEFLNDMIGFLRKEDNVDDTKDCLLKCKSLVFDNDMQATGFDALNKYVNCWDGNELDEYQTQFLFDLDSYLLDYDCITRIKCIECVVSRICSLLTCHPDNREDNDALLLIKLITLMLRLDQKGSIFNTLKYFMPILLSKPEWYDSNDVRKCLNVLQDSTHVIANSLRIIIHLGQFDFEWLQKNKYLHQVWLTYFYVSLMALAHGCYDFETNLSDLQKHQLQIHQKTKNSMLCVCWYMPFD